MAYRKPKRMFEDSGLVDPAASYCVALDNVVNTKKQDIKTMVDAGRYFSIFAPRQSGKTTFLDGIRRELHAHPSYVAALLSFEDCRDLDKTEFYSLLELELYEQLITRLKEVDCQKIAAVEELLANHHLTNHVSFRLLFEKLNRLIEYKKIFVFIDEFDGIPLDEIANFLTALRKLYLKYKTVKEKALYTVGLIGIRNITKLVVGGVSPFNIADQVDLPPFSLTNVHDLYNQYTGETGQPFTEEAIQRVYNETGGQSWLVNRLGTILTIDVKPETTEPVDESDVEKAINILVNEKNDHFDNLYEKAKLYKETFVGIVFDPVEYVSYDEEQGWLEQYGLIKNSNGYAVVANNIYKAVFIKIFFKEVKAYEDIPLHSYEAPNGKLDMKRIISKFEQYIMEIGVSAFYRNKRAYEKTGQFLLTAWLYQFARNGNGEVRYEVRSGLGRMDILLTYKGVKYIVETKINRYNDMDKTIDDGVKQLSTQYLTSESTSEGYLVIFDVKTDVGITTKPVDYQAGDKSISCFIIGIGRP